MTNGQPQFSQARPDLTRRRFRLAIGFIVLMLAAQAVSYVWTVNYGYKAVNNLSFGCGIIGVDDFQAADPFEQQGMRTIWPRGLKVAYLSRTGDEVIGSLIPGIRIYPYAIGIPLVNFMLPLAVVAFISWRQVRKVSTWACGACSYDLRGATSSVCSECGTTIPLEQMRRIRQGRV